MAYALDDLVASVDVSAVLLLAYLVRMKRLCKLDQIPNLM